MQPKLDTITRLRRSLRVVSEHIASDPSDLNTKSQRDPQEVIDYAQRHDENVYGADIKNADPTTAENAAKPPKKQSKRLKSLLGQERCSKAVLDVGIFGSDPVNGVTAEDIKKADPNTAENAAKPPKKQSKRLKSLLGQERCIKAVSDVGIFGSVPVNGVTAEDIKKADPNTAENAAKPPKKQSKRLKSLLGQERCIKAVSDVGIFGSVPVNGVTAEDIKKADPNTAENAAKPPKKQSKRLKSLLGQERCSKAVLDVGIFGSDPVNGVTAEDIKKADPNTAENAAKPPKKQSKRLKSLLGQERCIKTVSDVGIFGSVPVNGVTAEDIKKADPNTAENAAKPPKKQSKRLKSLLGQERYIKAISDVVNFHSDPVNGVIAEVNNNSEPTTSENAAKPPNQQSKRLVSLLDQGSCSEVLSNVASMSTEQLPDKFRDVSVGLENEKTEEIQVNDNEPTKKHTRHRKQVKSSWPREITKNNRERGKAFKGYTKTDKGMVYGVDRPERQLGPRCSSQFCLTSKKRNCHDVNEIKRAENFNCFWDDLNWDQKKIYVASLVDVDNTQRKVVEESRRSVSSKYFLKIDNRRVQVCKQFFLSSFGLNEWMVRDWTTNNNNGMITEKATLNSRRKAIRPLSQKSLADKERKDFLLKFFNDLPKMPSHYCRQRTDKSYIEPNFQSLAEIYRYYQLLCTESKKGSLSYGFFCDVFKDQKLSLYQPKKDRCDTCEGYDMGNVGADEYNEHVSLKDRARQEKDKDKNRALAGEIHAFVWDVEAVKLCPVSNASTLFFKLKLKVHNFTIYDLGSKECMNNWWHEGEGGMDASIFTTCVNDFFNERCNDDLPIVVWSDGCGYQNRNQILSNALLDYAVRYNKNVQQKFLVKGHTQMEVDNVHALIEKKLKGRKINLPSDYIKATKEARKTIPLEAKLYHHQDFRNYDDARLFRYNSIRPGKNTGDDTVQDLRVLDYSPTGVISFKINFDHPLQPLPRKSKQPDISYDQLQPLYTEEIKISAKRYKDLQDLKIVLSKDSHTFYDQLKHEIE